LIGASGQMPNPGRQRTRSHTAHIIHAYASCAPTATHSRTQTRAEQHWQSILHADSGDILGYPARLTPSLDLACTWAQAGRPRYLQPAFGSPSRVPGSRPGPAPMSVAVLGSTVTATSCHSILRTKYSTCPPRGHAAPEQDALARTNHMASV